MSDFESLNSQTTRETDEELLLLRLETISEVIADDIQTTSLNRWQHETLRRLGADLQPDQTIDLPTRTGKSHLIREIAQSAQDSGVRVAIVSHRRHILDEHSQELTETNAVTQEIGKQTGEKPGILLLSAQRIATNDSLANTLADEVDLVLVDEAHRALGEKTVEGMRSIFPNAVRIAFTATPDYADNRSVTDEYGDKLISHSVVEAIESGYASSVRAFLYKTNAVIDVLDPNMADFTPRELERLSNLMARNQAIVDVTQDLVSQGRRGLITTIPGEDLSHAETLKTMLDTRTVEEDGGRRFIRTHVVRGGDAKLAEKLEDFENGEVDVLLYCDLLREGYTTETATFLINGRPTTSAVNLTQDIGRVLQVKDQEAIIVDFQDTSVKQQRTVYDILELDRCVQGVYVGPDTVDAPDPETYLEGLFRPDLLKAFKSYNNQLISELRYSAYTPDRIDKLREKFLKAQAEDFARESKKWGRVLAQESLYEEPGTDMFGIDLKTQSDLKKLSHQDDGSFVYDVSHTSRNWLRAPLQDNAWVGIENSRLGLPVVTLTPQKLHESFANMSEATQELDLELHALAVDALTKIRTVFADNFSGLSAREVTVIKERFGLTEGSAGPKTFEELGDMLGITRERVRQIESKTLAKLRHPHRSHDLRDLLGQDLKIAEADTESLESLHAKAKQSVGHKKLWGLNPTAVAQNQARMQERDSVYEAIGKLFEHGDLTSYATAVMLELVKSYGISSDYAAQKELIDKIITLTPNTLERAARFVHNHKPSHSDKDNWLRNYDGSHTTKVAAQNVREALEELS